MDLKGFELDSLLRIFLVIRNFLLEKKGKGFSGDFVVLGVGGQSENLVPKKFEEIKGLIEAISLI